MQLRLAALRDAFYHTQDVSAILDNRVAALGDKLEKQFGIHLPGKTGIDIYFSPNGGCTAAIVAEISAAKKSVYVLAYSFTSVQVASALILAYGRKLDVKIVLDPCNIGSAGSQLQAVYYKTKIPLWIDGEHAIAHNKVIVIDKSTVVTGSFNFSEQAETGNAENLIIVRQKDVAKKYLDNFNLHLGHSVPYVPTMTIPANVMPEV